MKTPIFALAILACASCGVDLEAFGRTANDPCINPPGAVHIDAAPYRIALFECDVADPAQQDACCTYTRLTAYGTLVATACQPECGEWVVVEPVMWAD